MLAINSIDRYTVPLIGSNGYLLTTLPASQDNSLYALYNNSYINAQDFYGIPRQGPQATSASFSLNNAGPLIYGYIRTIVISQLQIDCRIPTVVPSNQVFPAVSNLTYLPLRKGNDTLPILWTEPGITKSALITIPYGFSTPDELAAMLQILIRAQSSYLATFTVTYTNSNTTPPNTKPPGNGNCFVFIAPAGILFRFPCIEELLIVPGSFQFTKDQVTVVLKTYRLLGINITNTALNVNGFPQLVNYLTTGSPNFLFTPFVDIISQNLTKFQKIKDTDTASSKRNSIISRVYLSGVGNPQNTSSSYSLGSEPFLMTADLNTPKIIRWSPDETVYNLDFQIIDQYGDLIYWDASHPTEFQMTLLCAEGD
jgi:hypothetical protein